MNADILFFSARGLGEDGNFSDSSIEENNLRRAMMQRAQQKIMLLDSSKLGERYIDVLCHVRDVSEIVCETPLPASLMDMMKG